MSPSELGVTAVLFVWVIFVAYFLTARLYNYMKRRGVEDNVAVYYDRKVIHVLTGGVVAAIVPFVFKSPLLPFTMAMLLALL
ncbi:MAG: dolichol kinase, partial [Candidatus Bathyarchaeota archaeon]|nr:dolichol kinase [Candidatus Bathyarchaeota archaeon]